MHIQRTNTILYCAKWAETVAFYRDIFQFPVSHETSWFVEFQMTGNAYLSIADESHASIDSVGGQGITLSWEVADMAGEHAMLSERGVTVSPIQNKWDAKLFYLHDPEGHRIELWQVE